MALYVYLKARPKTFLSAVLPVFSGFLLMSGLSIIIWAAYPIMAFEIFLTPKFSVLIKPIPEGVIAEAMENRNIDNPSAILGVTDTFAETDYTKASNWFPKSPQRREEKEGGGDYTLSIPKLNIKDALVSVGGEDLNKSLIHYGGTGFPGEYGNAVIFGHSVLPAFFDPKNYRTIFSTLPTLANGDEIFTTYDGVTYRYVVWEMRVVSADDISVLEQKYDTSYVSLVTCVPPGTYWKKLIVKGRLEKI